ncbi:MAG: DNA helicase [Syntrophothermus sp.]
MTDKEIIQDISVEGIVVGMIFRKPSLLNEYSTLITPEYDFSDNSTRFVYNLILYVFCNGDIVNETSLNVAVSKMDEGSQRFYKKIGGFNLVKRLETVSKISEDFKHYYERLKAYNVLRQLDNKGFSVRKNLNMLKEKNYEQIIKAYESQLTKISGCIQGVNDSIRLGNDIIDIYENLKNTPQIGIDIPFPIINSFMRGFSQGTFNAIALHSGYGKSRMIAFIIAYTSIINQIPMLLMINEQEKLEIDLMILTCIANNVYGKKYGITINESTIALGKCNYEENNMVLEAAKFIKERSKIQFLEIQNWSFDSLKLILRQHKLRGIDYAIVDTFKAMRSNAIHGVPEWLQFAYTAEQLKSIIGSEAKGGLYMGLLVTMQLTDESLQTKVLNSTSIANSKQIKHSLDYLQMSRILDYRDKEKYKVKINIPNNPFNGQIQDLDMNKTYYLTFIDKNRRGKDKVNLIFEVSKGEMIFKELGYAVKYSN